MKKKGITLVALLGIIIGIIFVIVLLSFTFKIIRIGATDTKCLNEYYWESIKENLKLLDAQDMSFTSFFPTGKNYCHLASFDFNYVTIQTPGEVAQKNQAAICLCKKISDKCELSDCYYFKTINAINSVKLDSNLQKTYEQLNTNNPPQGKKDYLFLRFKKSNDILEIDTNIY